MENASLTKRKSKLKIVRIASRIRNSPSISKRDGFNNTPKSTFSNGSFINTNQSVGTSEDIVSKLRNISNNVFENMKDIDNNIESMYKMVNKYNDEHEKKLSRPEIQQTLKNKFSFYNITKEQEAIIMSRKQYNNERALLGAELKNPHDKDLTLPRFETSGEKSLTNVRNFLLETPRSQGKGLSKKITIY
jgi:hypothetical protein